MTDSRWRNKAAPIIARVLAETKGQDEGVIAKALYDAYPFGERRVMALPQVQVRVRDEEEWRLVDALLVLPTYAVSRHQPVSGDEPSPLWCITHVKTGRRVVPRAYAAVDAIDLAYAFEQCAPGLDHDPTRSLAEQTESTRRKVQRIKELVSMKEAEVPA